MLRIGITGKPRIGKTTIIKEVIRRLKSWGIVVGGMLTTDIQKERIRIGFQIEDINTGEKGILAHINQEGPKVGKYGINTKDLDALGVKSIKDALAYPNIRIIIVDEIGRMELKSKNFIHVMEEAISSNEPKPMIVSVHQKSQHEIVRRIKRDFKIFEVTEENRGEIAKKIVDNVLQILHKNAN